MKKCEVGYWTGYVCENVEKREMKKRGTKITQDRHHYSYLSSYRISSSGFALKMTVLNNPSSWLSQPLSVSCIEFGKSFRVMCQGRPITVGLSGRKPLRCTEQELRPEKVIQLKQVYVSMRMHPFPCESISKGRGPLPGQWACRWLSLSHKAVGIRGSQQVALLRGIPGQSHRSWQGSRGCIIGSYWNCNHIFILLLYYIIIDSSSCYCCCNCHVILYVGTLRLLLEYKSINSWITFQTFKLLFAFTLFHLVSFCVLILCMWENSVLKGLFRRYPLDLCNSHTSFKQ